MKLIERYWWKPKLEKKPTPGKPKNEYENPFWKICLRNNLSLLLSPADLFGLLLIGGMIGLLFLPLKIFMSLIGCFGEEANFMAKWCYAPMGEGFLLGLVAFVSYMIGKEKNNHYVTRELIRLLNEGQIEEQVYLRMITCE